MAVNFVGGIRLAVAIEKEICAVHRHEDDWKTKAEARREIARDLVILGGRLFSDEARAVDEKHQRWQEDAIASSTRAKNELMKKEGMKLYVERHPGATATQVRDACDSDVDPHCICNMRRRMFGVTTNLRDLMDHGGHHLLGQEGDDILVFCRSTAFHGLATTPLIQGMELFQALFCRSHNCIFCTES